MSEPPPLQEHIDALETGLKETARSTIIAITLIDPDAAVVMAEQLAERLRTWSASSPAPIDALYERVAVAVEEAGDAAYTRRDRRPPRGVE